MRVLHAAVLFFLLGACGGDGLPRYVYWTGVCRATCGADYAEVAQTPFCIADDLDQEEADLRVSGHCQGVLSTECSTYSCDCEVSPSDTECVPER